MLSSLGSSVTPRWLARARAAAPVNFVVSETADSDAAGDVEMDDTGGNVGNVDEGDVGDVGNTESEQLMEYFDGGAKSQSNSDTDVEIVIINEVQRMLL